MMPLADMPFWPRYLSHATRLGKPWRMPWRACGGKRAQQLLAAHPNYQADLARARDARRLVSR